MTMESRGRDLHAAEPVPEQVDRQRPVSAETVDFHNMDALDEALLGDDPALLAGASEFLRVDAGFSEQRVKDSIAAQKLRREVHAAMRQKKAERLASGSPPTADELSMGAFREALEPQVREAILEMRRKGYDTVSSGFDSLDWQAMVFAGNLDESLDADTRIALESLGVKMQPKSLWFASGGTDLAGLKARWDQVAALLPDLGHRVPDTAHRAAVRFRETFQKPDVK